MFLDPSPASSLPAQGDVADNAAVLKATWAIITAAALVDGFKCGGMPKL